MTGTFRHSAANVIDLYVTSDDQPIGTTANHPFWSESRQDFVQAGTLQPGEELRTATTRASAHVRQLIPRSRSAQVFNLEVDAEHCYAVGRNGVVVHNSNSYNNGLPNGAPDGGTQRIFKAPQPGKGQKLLNDGFHPDDFPSGGPYADGKAYFAKERALAEQYSGYGEAILEVEIPKSVYDARIRPHEVPYLSDPRFIEIPIPLSEFDVSNNALRRLLDE